MEMLLACGVDHIEDMGPERAIFHGGQVVVVARTCVCGYARPGCLVGLFVLLYLLSATDQQQQQQDQHHLVYN